MRANGPRQPLAQLGLLLPALAVVIGLACWIETHSIAIGVVAAGLAIAALASSAISLIARRSAPSRWRDRLDSGYRVLSMLSAALIGSLAAATLLEQAPADIRILAVGFALVFASGIAARHPHRPALAFAKLVLTLGPVVVACAVVGSTGLLVLAVTLPLLAASMTLLLLTAAAALSQRIADADMLAAQSQEMREAAQRDDLTGLLNRSGLMPTAETLRAGLSESRKLALYWLDLHRFREVNETLGHAAGDRMLQEMAARMRAVAPGSSMVARFASDEFVVLAELADRAAADTLAGELSYRLAAPLRLAGHRLEGGAAIGAALLPDDAEDIPELLERADLALYHARIGARNQVCFFDPDMTREKVRKKEIEADLRGALQRDELSVFFQPIIDLDTGRIRTFEALVRWFHPDRGEIAPSEFIPVAEESGLIITLGNWIAKRAARACAAWPEHVSLAINLSPMQIRAPGAALGILQALAEAGLDPGRLQLEVTESLFVEHDANARLFVQELGAKGVEFVLDDFGTGNSSLLYINSYPFAAIKVDRSFVSGPLTGKRSDAIIRAVAEMGQTLGMEIVAEGLETLEQVRAVQRAGCTQGQGYFYSRPVPDHVAAALLAQEADETITRIAG